MVGNRIDSFLADLLKKEILIGRALDQGGAGYVEAHIEDGVLVGIEPNSGIRLLELDEALKQQISEKVEEPKGYLDLDSPAIVVRGRKLIRPSTLGWQIQATRRAT